MGFNYAKEKAKFDAKWKKLRAEYENAGMRQEDIQAMHDYDWEVFCADRVYRNHTQDFPDEVLTGEERDRLSSLFRKYITFSVTFGIEDFEERFAWVDSLDNQHIIDRIRLLTADDLELLTFIVLEGHSQRELAQKKGCSQNTISKQFKKIKKFLK